MKTTCFEPLQSGTFTDRYDRMLIKAVAICTDFRTGETCPLTFYLCRNLLPSEVNRETVISLITILVISYGYSFCELEDFEIFPISFNAQELWDVQHKALPQ